MIYQAHTVSIPIIGWVNNGCYGCLEFIMASKWWLWVRQILSTRATEEVIDSIKPI